MSCSATSVSYDGYIAEGFERAQASAMKGYQRNATTHQPHYYVPAVNALIVIALLTFTLAVAIQSKLKEWNRKFIPYFLVGMICLVFYCAVAWFNYSAFKADEDVWKPLWLAFAS